MTESNWPLWWQRAACLSTPIEVFFSESEFSLKLAESLCARCNVRPACAREALAMSRVHMENGDAHLDSGYFAGMTPEARQRIVHDEIHTTTDEQKGHA